MTLRHRLICTTCFAAERVVTVVCEGTPTEEEVRAAHADIEVGIGDHTVAAMRIPRRALTEAEPTGPTPMRSPQVQED